MSRVANLLFYCTCLVGCVLLFAKWLFSLCFIHVVCVLWWRMFSGIVRIYIIIRYSPFLLGFLF